MDLVQSGRVEADILKEYMGATGKILINTVSTGWERQAQYAAIENAIRANPDLTGIPTLDAATTPAMGRALMR